MPITSDAALRASAIYHRRDGVFDNISGRSPLDAVDHLGGRAALRWNPSADLDITVTAEAERDRDDGLIARSNSFPISGDPRFGTVDGPVSSNGPLRDNRDLYGGNLRVRYRIGDYSLTSISAVRGYRVNYAEDTDSTPLTLLHFSSYERQDAQSQELRLNSPDSARFHWFLGANIYHERLRSDVIARYDEDAVCTGLAKASSAITCDAFFRGTPSPDPAFATLFDYLNAAGVINDPYVGATGLSEHNSSRGNYLSWGLYGDATFELTDTLSLTGGLRYSHDHKAVGIAADPAASVLTLVNGTNLILRAGSQTAGQAWGQVQPRAVISWKPAATVSAYASYTRGYKSGGFNVLQPGDPAFRPEKVSSYEVGSKGSLIGRQLRYEVAGFYWQYDDLQVQVYEGGLPVVRNAGRARGYGTEVSLDWLAGDGIQVLLDAAWLNARYSRFLQQAGTDYAGNRLPLAPDFTGHAGLVYEHEVGSGRVNLRADTIYRSLTFYSPDNGSLRQNGYALVSARLGYAFANGVDVAVRGENLTDIRYAVSGQAISALNISDLRIGQPRIVSIEAGYKW